MPAAGFHARQVLAMKGKVYLMGAGPGDPDLLTVKAVRALRAAEVVLHDDLVAPEILELAPASAQVRSVQKLGLLADSLQEKIHSLLISAAREGHQVVRLKAVDLLPSGHADEETEALAQAGIDFEVIPGATSAMGAAAGANSR
jgi:siroheme synthase